MSRTEDCKPECPEECFIFWKSQLMHIDVVNSIQIRKSVL